MIKLPPLPYSKKALEPYISEETLSFHYDKHHKGYCDKLNKLIENTPDAKKPLIDIILSSEGDIFNNAAQIWNHSFYWMSMSDKHHQNPDDNVLTALKQSFGTYEDFIDQFTQSALSLFGSGYTWLVFCSKNKELMIINTANAETPLTQGLTPLLTIDVWEHAYYLDSQNLRPKYIENFFSIINWQFVSENLNDALTED